VWRVKNLGLAWMAVGWIALAGVAKAQDLPVEHGTTRAEVAVLDPARDAAGAPLERAIHQPLPEEYIWTSTERAAAVGSAIIYKFPGVTQQTEKHYFRHAFDVANVPAMATLYVAGPRYEKVWINGQLADEVTSDLSSPLGMHVFATDVARYLHTGKNTIALEVVRGRGVTGFANSALVKQQTFGQVVVAKIVPAAKWVEAKPLMMSDKSWKGTTMAAAGWEKSAFDDAAWKPVQSIGGIESSIELYQWNADAGLYDWPGYDGISGFLAHKQLKAQGIKASYTGRSGFENAAALTGGAGEFAVRWLADGGDAPSVLLDFGREITGRLEVKSDSDAAVRMTFQYGEDEIETLKAPYLGVNTLTVAPHAVGYGAKSAFRFVKLRFVDGPAMMRFQSIGVDHIFYPVEYKGSFESSDAGLNRIWETGAYTTHLCMQDGLWDASKRDRGRWSGDNDISARVADVVFGDHYLLEDTMDRLIGDAPVTQHVNGIPGYSSYWFTQVAEYYRHTGNKEFLRATHDRAVQLLEHIDAEFDERDLYANKTKVWLYVDWSPELNGDTSESRRASEFEFYRGYREGAWMLREVGDIPNAEKYEKRAAAIKIAADKYLLDPATGTYGPRWQTNAMAVLSGIATPDQYDAIWTKVLSQVGHVTYNAYIISPYYNYYVISAMAKMGHRAEALAWVRQYWGGMIAEGATSFWEAYDPSWYKEDFHAALQSDNRSGYFVSLAHGWSSGPTAWLMEEVLGIRPTAGGFSVVEIRPDLMGLKFARGAEPTPHGLLKVDLMPGVATVDVPDGVMARVSVAGSNVKVNGAGVASEPAEGGSRRLVTLSRPGHYVVEGN
jgi:alpha-L-rhamnosidase